MTKSMNSKCNIGSTRRTQLRRIDKSGFLIFALFQVPRQGVVVAVYVCPLGPDY